MVSIYYDQFFLGFSGFFVEFVSKDDQRTKWFSVIITQSTNVTIINCSTNIVYVLLSACYVTFLARKSPDHDQCDSPELMAHVIQELWLYMY